jgi:hypothetical protein
MVGLSPYTAAVLERTTIRVLPVVNRAVEHTPMATVCCNACRTCTTSNILGLLFAGAGGLALGLRRLTRRFF